MEGQRGQGCDQAQAESALLRLGTASAGSCWYCLTSCNTAVRSLRVLLLYRTVCALETVTTDLGRMSHAGALVSARASGCC